MPFEVIEVGEVQLRRLILHSHPKKEIVWRYRWKEEWSLWMNLCSWNKTTQKLDLCFPPTDKDLQDAIRFIKVYERLNG